MNLEMDSGEISYIFNGETEIDLSVVLVLEDTEAKKV